LNHLLGVRAALAAAPQPRGVFAQINSRSVRLTAKAAGLGFSDCRDQGMRLAAGILYVPAALANRMPEPVCHISEKPAAAFPFGITIRSAV
jgi:hypothetical protein